MKIYRENLDSKLQTCKWKEQQIESMLEFLELMELMVKSAASLELKPTCQVSKVDSMLSSLKTTFQSTRL